MNELARCPKCGTGLPADAPAGLCPKCLVQAGLESEPNSEAVPQPTESSPASAGFVPPTVTELAGRFPQLEILGLVGRGGMGAVYKARQRELDRIVAVKILPPEVGRDPSFAQRFSREARALARLNHPNIVAVHDFGQTGGLYYFVMEFIDGTNLRQAMLAGQLPPQQALAIVPQICDALQYAHDEGVVHRDIKPENILLDKRGRVKIADFGLSKLIGADGTAAPELALTGTHQVMGTIRYMAPEQLEGAKAVDHRADIYSLGVVFYEMLTGELPLGRFAPPSQKVQVDVRLDEVVLRALEKEPQRRYQQASEVKTAVEAIPKEAKATAPAPQAAASDGVVFRRLSVFNLLIWLVWSALLAGLQWGYLSHAQWYSHKELPYDWLNVAWGWASLLFAFSFVYWWYLLAKSPQTPRSFSDALRCMQTPDRRAIRLWINAPLFLAMWVVATVVTMSLANDAVQSTTLIALFIAAPLVAAGSCLWAYRERIRQLLRDHGRQATMAP
jgi:serine/threonine protein kinase